MKSILILTSIAAVGGAIFFGTQKLRNFVTTVKVLPVGIPSIDFTKAFTGIIPISQKFKLNNHSKLSLQVDSIAASLYFLKGGVWTLVADNIPTSVYTIQPNSANPFTINFEAPVLKLPLSAITNAANRKFKVDLAVNVGGQIIEQTEVF